MIFPGQSHSGTWKLVKLDLNWEPIKQWKSLFFTILSQHTTQNRWQWQIKIRYADLTVIPKCEIKSAK